MLALAAAVAIPTAAQSDEEWWKKVNSDFDEFGEKVDKEFESFRNQINKQYEDFMRQHWSPTEISKPLPPPVEKEPAPDVEPEEEAPKPVEKPKPVVIEKVVPPAPEKPRPKPVEPIKEVPVKVVEKPMEVKFYGTDIKLRKADLSGFKLAGKDENAFADGWKHLAQESTNNLIADCLKVRDQYRLPDWGYVQFLDKLAAQLKGEGSNEKVMLLGFLLNQSGYKTRFAYDKERNLHMLFSSDGTIYNHMRYYVDGEWFYSYTNPPGDEVYICKFETPKEQSVSMGIEASPLFTYQASDVREVKAKNHPEVMVKLSPNKNLIDFFNDYPEATLDKSPYSKWMIHGNTPVSAEVKEQLYPALRKAVEGKSQLEGVGILLKLAQSFPYEYDDVVWGVPDRVFWMEESWFYPYSDCEDHALNFSHMVRDIMGLDVCLVYYPGHLSSCVAFTEGEVKGDYIDYEGKRYTVCDPTYFYAGVGKTGPSNDNSEAILVPLKRGL